MSKRTKNPKVSIDPAQKLKLQHHATNMIRAFLDGVVSESDQSSFNGPYGFSFFEGYTAQFTKSFLDSQADFTQLAAKVLKAKAAHEPTIRTLGLKASQRYVQAIAGNKNNDQDGKQLQTAVQSLIDTTLEELSKIYKHIEANFLTVHHGYVGVIELGRVRSMTTEDATKNTPLSNLTKIRLVPGRYGENFLLPDGVMAVGMPDMTWVVDVPATKENVAEEAKSLIDVAVSFMRLSASPWTSRFPKIGEIEPHPILPAVTGTPHVSFHGEMTYTGGWKVPPIYEITPGVAVQLQLPITQKKANFLFDPPGNSLAMRVAQGLGWMTRGRQVSDRAERLLSFFTALEALLTSKDKSDPVTQTISRYVSVIQTQKLNERVAIYNKVKALYGLRSAVVHSGKREVLWQDVNTLQALVEDVYCVVLKNCDLSMSQDTFAQSLAEASHGLPWVFAAPK